MTSRPTTGNKTNLKNEIRIMKPKQTPITGRENKDDLSTQMLIISKFYEAFNNKDLDKIAEVWAHTDDISAENPAGGIRRGWTEIRAVYEGIFNSRAKVKAEFYDYTLHEAGEIFYAVGRESVELETGGQTIHADVRITRIYRLTAGKWKQIHLHGSIDDADLLAKYQRAVQSK